MQLSDHFALEELTHTQLRDISNEAPPEVVANLTELAVRHLEAIRARWGRLYVSSGYRCPALNQRIGGAPDSAHLYGCAADLVPLEAGVTVTEMLLWIRDESGLVFDQVIDEKAHGPGWLHYGYSHPHHTVARRECLVMRSGSYTRTT